MNDTTESEGEPSPGWYEQMYLEYEGDSGLVVDAKGRAWHVTVTPASANPYPDQ